MEVKEEAEESFVQDVDRKLAGSVFSAGCSNWYIGAAGRNSASWPGKAANFWTTTLFPQWGSYVYGGGDSSWFARSLYRHIKGAVTSKIGAASAVGALLVLIRKEAIVGESAAVLGMLRNFASSQGLLKA